MTEPLPQDAIDAYLKGMTIRAVAEEFGMSPSRVRRGLHIAGVAMRSPGTRPKGRLDLKQASAMYIIDGLTIEEIARRMGASRRAVTALLKEGGVKIRPRGGDDAHPEISTDTLKALYVDQELTLAQIGKEVGMDPTSVWWRLRRAGVQMRSPGGPRMVRR